MRARTYKAAHRNLADSKRSIVMMCAGLAMILGTTSVGASMFSFGADPMLVERTGTSVAIDANGDNEVIIDEPTIQTLQGQTTTIPRKPQSTLQISKKPQSNLQISSIITAPLLNQIIPAPAPTPSTPGEVASNPGTTNPDAGAGAGTNPGTTEPGTGAGNGETEPDPDETVGGGDDGGIVEDNETIIVDDAPHSQGNTTHQQPASSAPLQGSSTSPTTS